MSIREQIIQSIVSDLTGTPGVSGRVYRSREDALSREESPSIVIEVERDDFQQEYTPFVGRRLRVWVAVYARGEAPDQAADYPLLSAYQRVMGNPQRGGLAIDTTTGDTDFELDGADGTACWARMAFEVLYRHQRADMTAA